MSDTIQLRGLFIWGICAIFFTYEFLLRTVVGSFQYPLMQDLLLSPISFALISSTAYQLIYGAMQIPVGIITDKLGLKYTCFMAVVLCAMATFGFAISTGFYTAFLFRVVMGLGSSFGFICLLIVVYDWLPRKHIAFFIGLSQFVGTLGPMVAAGPISSLSQIPGVTWRVVFMMLGAFGLILSCFVFLYVDKNRQSKGSFLILTKPKAIWTNLSKMLTEPQVWYIALYSAGLYFSIEYLSENEGVHFLREKGLSDRIAPFMLSLAWLGYGIGCPIIGFLSDYFQRRKPIMLVCAIVLLVSLSAIIYIPMTLPLICLAFVLLGVGSSGQSIAFAIMAENCKEEYVALGMGFNNGMMMLVAAINAPLLGFILSFTRKAGIAGYQEAFFFLPAIVLFSSLICFFMIKESFCKSMVTNTKLSLSH